MSADSTQALGMGAARMAVRRMTMHCAERSIRRRKSRELESLHDAIQFRSANILLKWPLIVTGFGLLGFVANLGSNLGGAFLIGIPIAGGGGYWAYSGTQKRGQIEGASSQAEVGRQSLQQEARALLS